MKRILVPCDFSEPAMQAFKFAVDMARQGRGEIHLLNVVELPVLYDTPAVIPFEQSYMDDLKVSAEKNFKKMKGKWAADVNVKTIVEFGSLLSTIRKTVIKVKADVVVVGTHGASGFKEYTIGSNTEKLVRTIGVPVIAIKKAPKSVKNIVFPTTPDLDQEELTMKVKDLQDFFKANLHVVYVNTPSRFMRDVDTKPALAALAKRYMLKNFTISVVNDLSEVEGIINFTDGIKADLVAMRTHGRRGIAHLTISSIAENLVNHIECPIWTYRIE